MKAGVYTERVLRGDKFYSWVFFQAPLDFRNSIRALAEVTLSWHTQSEFSIIIGQTGTPRTRKCVSTSTTEEFVLQFTTHLRGSLGGVVVPCSLITSHVCEGGPKTINIINNNITLSALSNSATFTGKQSKEFKDPVRGGKRGPVQITFLKPRKTGNCEKKSPPGKVRNTGRFQKRSIVSVDKTRPVAPSIPLNTRGLRRFLR